MATRPSALAIASPGVAPSAGPGEADGLHAVPIPDGNGLIIQGLPGVQTGLTEGTFSLGRRKG